MSLKEGVYVVSNEDEDSGGGVIGVFKTAKDALIYLSENHGYHEISYIEMFCRKEYNPYGEDDSEPPGFALFDTLSLCDHLESQNFTPEIEEDLRTFATNEKSFSLEERLISFENLLFHSESHPTILPFLEEFLVDGWEDHFKDFIFDDGIRIEYFEIKSYET
jgi:hypothetical protein